MSDGLAWLARDPAMVTDGTPEDTPGAPVAGDRPDANRPARIVFIAGSSFSGSTLMGLMLGSCPEAIYVGELKDYKRRMEVETVGAEAFCSCGRSRSMCPFWSVVQDHYGSETHLNPAPGFSWRNAILGIRILTGLEPDSRRETSHGSLVRAISREARARNPGVLYVVDSSKSVQNLDAIYRSPNVELSVIHLIRDGMAVAGSYKKRGFGTLYAIASWSIGNIFISLYLKRRRLRSVRVDYRSLCLGDEKTYAALNEFLGISLKPDAAAGEIRNTKYHIVSGNGKVRRSASDFQGIHYSESPSNPTAFERFLADVVVRPLNRLFGVTSGQTPVG
ncbi:MAG: hypothetical protein ACRELU_13750 [Gemmatimonadota bacterium]